MGCTACTEPQCLYSTAIPLLTLWAVRPVQSLSACTTLHFTFTFTNLTYRLCVRSYNISGSAKMLFCQFLYETYQVQYN